jgi:hypothetical protein
MIDGPKLTLGGQEFTVPPANLKAIRAHTEARTKADATAQDKIDANVAFILTTLRRNYPDLTEDFVLEHVDARNQIDVMQKIQQAAGYTKVEPGEAQAGTEA